MAEHTYPFPEDEFDSLGKNRAPQAVHRAPRPWWRVWGPLIAVVVLAPLLAIALVKVATNDGAGGTPVTSPTASASAEATDAATDQPTDGATAEPSDAATTEAPTTEPTAEPTTAAPIDQSVAVSVLNGARVQGLAGSVQEQLQADGWTQVTAGNYTSAQPEVSTVFYATPDLAPAAQAIASTLGIGPVTELADIDSITVVLRPDFPGVG